MQESAAGIARRWACFRTCCKAGRPILQIGIARRRRAYARRLRRPFGRSNAKKRRSHGVFHLCPENGRTRWMRRLPLPPASCRNIRRNKSSPPLQRRGTVTVQAKVPTGCRRRRTRAGKPGRSAWCKPHPVGVQRVVHIPPPTHRPSALPAGVVFPHLCKRSVFHRQNFVRKGGQFHMMGDKKNRFAAIPKHRIEQPVL